MEFRRNAHYLGRVKIRGGVMVTFKCDLADCANKGVEYNFLGNPEIAECGGCQTMLEAYDQRPDPEPTPFPIGE